MPADAAASSPSVHDLQHKIEMLEAEVRSAGRLPRHLAIIMDGNGRWAQARGLPRLAGHHEGAKAVRRTVTYAREIGVRYLTLYSFSLENWSRPQPEVSGLMNLVMLPMWLLSGTFFSAARFPSVLQPLIKVLPLTALNDALRAVINEGLPLHSTWLEIGIMLFWCVASFAVALRIFRWQ